MSIHLSAQMPPAAAKAAKTVDDRSLVEVSNLTVDIVTEGGSFTAIRDVSLQLRRNEVLGLVGESGSGKSITAAALMRMLPPAATVTGGGITFDGVDMLGIGERELRRVRGNRIGMIFQDPLTSLNPLMTVGAQLVEAIRLHDRDIRKDDVLSRSHELLRSVGIPAPTERMRSYPHELSGGMRQRVMIAMAICNHPDLLIADEPTTALDVTTQAQVLDTLAAARERTGSALLLITHDLGVIAEQADRVAVMYHGRIVETGTAAQILQAPQHPYTVGLLRCRPSRSDRTRIVPIPGSPPRPMAVIPGCSFAPRCARRQGRDVCTHDRPLLREHDEGERGHHGGHLAACHFALDPAAPAPVAEARADKMPADAEPVLSVRDLTKTFPLRKRAFRRPPGVVRAVNRVSLDLVAGRTLALVGESGSGKSTTARAVLRLIEPTSGDVDYNGHSVLRFNTRQLRRFRTEAQIVFQDPYSSLNPRKTVQEAIAEPMRVHGLMHGNEKARVAELLASVGLHPEYASRFPHEFSGGQRQRICIARAIGLQPDVLVLDEPVSALDVSIQAQILALLDQLQQDRGMAYLLITHDLAVVHNVADDVAIMYLGHVVEAGPADRIFTTPAHPYTRVLLDAVPGWRRDDAVDRVRLEGDPPDPVFPPTGCPFSDRCYKARDNCRTDKPPLTGAASDPDHRVACHYPEGGLA